MAYRFVGYDPAGNARVFAEHNNIDVAETWCVEEMVSYVKSRPDLRPLSRWLVLIVDPIKTGADHGTVWR